MIVYRRRSRRRNPRFGAHRVTARFGKRGWSVSRKRSRLFRRSKSRSIRIRNPFRMPKLGGFIPSQTFAMTAIGVLGGLAIGSNIAPYYIKLPGLDKAQPKTQNIVAGLLNVVVGAFAAKTLKGELLKSVGIGIAAHGVKTALVAQFPDLAKKLGMDLSSDGLPPDLAFNPVQGDEVVRIGDEMVRVSADLSADEESVYERI
jgi:hypothetical protein